MCILLEIEELKIHVGETCAFWDCTYVVMDCEYKYWETSAGASYHFNEENLQMPNALGYHGTYIFLKFCCSSCRMFRQVTSPVRDPQGLEPHL